MKQKDNERSQKLLMRENNDEKEKRKIFIEKTFVLLKQTKQYCLLISNEYERPLVRNFSTGRSFLSHWSKLLKTKKRFVLS